MPFNLRNQLALLMWITLWLCIKTTEIDALPYGRRITPLKGIVKKVQAPPSEASLNKTTCNKNENFPAKIEKRIDTGIIDDNLKRTIASKPLVISIQNINPLEKTQQTASPIYSGFPKENINNRGATFFFTQVEPHRYEYRAMFQHKRNDFPHTNNFHNSDIFQPFVHHFDPFSRDFPPLPKFPAFPQIFPEHKDPFSHFPEHKDSFPNLPEQKDQFPNLPEHKDPFPNFPEHKDPFPNFPEHKDFFPNFPEFTFPTLPPKLKRAWEPDTEVQTQRPVVEQEFKRPLLKKYDIILGHNQYPKIFQFNEERINIEDFDREKKLKLYRLSKDGQNEIEPENVKRDHLLILHGGIFTVQEPPLFNKHVKKNRKARLFEAKVS